MTCFPYPINIVKQENGNIFIYNADTGDFVKSLSPDIIKIECNENDIVKVYMDNGAVEYFDAQLIDNTQILPSVGIPFVGNCNDLSQLLGNDFFFEIGSGSNNVQNIGFTDSANFDAFSRLRISNPLTLFNAQLTYDLCPLLFEQITNGTGASITHNTTNRYADITFSSTPIGGKSIMQSFEYLPYQPGKSQLIFITFNFVQGINNVIKFAGYSDGLNGIEFQLNGTQKQFHLYSSTSQGNVTKLQSEWNLDKLDGTGKSGINLDISKVQILVIDLQALYAGRVRVGFDIDGVIVYAHEFLHSNSITPPYLAYASLPVRCGMTCTDTVTTSMYFLCSAVISEGGGDDVSQFGYTFQQMSGSTNVLTSDTHIMTLRPKLLFNGLSNRSRVSFIDVEIYNGGNQPVQWDLVVGQALSGTTTFNNVSSLYSSTEYNTAGTLSGAYAVKIDGGWVPASGSVKSVTNTAINSRYPITLDASGNHRVLGTITLIMTSLSGTQPCRGAIKFREIR
jgi:hypothetical protein